MLLQVEVIKKAYMQGEIEVEEPQEGADEEEEHSASPRNVGHNIYILAHQVSRQPPEKPSVFQLLYVLFISHGPSLLAVHSSVSFETTAFTA